MKDLRSLWVLMATVFVDMIGFLMVLPLLPFYAERMGADPVVVTLLVAAFAVAQLLTSPFWGRFSDRLGRRPMILLGLLVSAVAFILFGLAQTLWLLFVSRLVQGMGGGTTSVVQAYVSDVVPAGERAKALGWMSAATSAGVTLGPLVGSLAASWGPAAPGFVAAGLCLLNAAFAWRWLPEPKPQAHGDDDDEEALAEAAGGASDQQSLLDAVIRVTLHPRRSIHALIWIYALGMMAFMAMNSVLALFLERRFDATEATIGWYYTYVGAMSFIMRAAILGPVVSALGEIRTLRLGALSLGFGLAAIPVTGYLDLSPPWNIAVLALAALFVPVGTALLFPATTSQISGRARRRQTGQTLGVQQLYGGFARVLGPLWAGFAFRDLGIPSPFWLSASLLIAVLGLSLWVEPMPHAASTPTSPGSDEEADPSLPLEPPTS